MQAPGGRGAREWGKRGSAGFSPAAPCRAPPAQRCPESVWPLGRHGQCTGDPRVLVRREGAGRGGRGATIPRSPPTPPRDDRAPCHSVSNPSQSWPLRAALLSAPGHFHPPRAQTVVLPPPTSTPPPPHPPLLASPAHCVPGPLSVSVSGTVRCQTQIPRSQHPTPPAHTGLVSRKTWAELGPLPEKVVFVRGLCPLFWACGQQKSNKVFPRHWSGVAPLGGKAAPAHPCSRTTRGGDHRRCLRASHLGRSVKVSPADQAGARGFSQSERARPGGSHAGGLHRDNHPGGLFKLGSLGSTPESLICQI